MDTKILNNDIVWIPPFVLKFTIIISSCFTVFKGSRLPLHSKIVIFLTMCYDGLGDKNETKHAR